MACACATQTRRCCSSRTWTSDMQFLDLHILESVCQDMHAEALDDAIADGASRGGRVEIGAAQEHTRIDQGDDHGLGGCGLEWRCV